VDGDKTKTITRAYLEKRELEDSTSYRKLYQGFVTKLVGLGKNAGIGIYQPNEFTSWASLVDHHDMQLDSELAQVSLAINFAIEVLEQSNESDLVDFDDLLYFAVRDQVLLTKFDFIFVDEAQDTNAIQRAILRKIMHKNSRLVAVGDPAQAIYGFRGADSESLNLIASEFSCERLPLTVTYRCPKKVVEVAHEWCSHLEAAENAEEGHVESLGEAWDTSRFLALDLVVCRTTKPLIKLGYQMMKARKPFYIMGKDIGQALKTLIRNFEAESISDLEHKLSSWCSREVEKAMKKDNEALAEAIRDKEECVQYLIQSMQNPSLHGLEKIIDDMFSEKGNATVLATVHKAKGLEADRVWWLNRSLCPSRYAKKDWQMQQEANICYVAATRAKRELYFIEEEREEF
jgi:superfamily I DNA/RNA helicase